MYANAHERIRFEINPITDRQVAGALGISPSTVADVVRRAQVVGVFWPLPEGTGAEWIEELLYPRGVISDNYF